MALQWQSIIVVIIALGLLAYFFLRSRAKKQRDLMQQQQQVPQQMYDPGAEQQQQVGGLLDGNTLLSENLSTMEDSNAPANAVATDGQEYAPEVQQSGAVVPEVPLGKEWNWPLVIILILIAIFFIWLIGYALSPRDRSGAPILSTSEPLFVFPTKTSTATGTRTSTVITATRTSTAAVPPPPPPPVIIATSTRTSTTTTPIIRPPTGGASIQVLGTGEIDVLPNEIQIFLHLSTTAPSDLEAQESLNGILSDFRGALRSLGIPETDIFNSTVKIESTYSTGILDLLSRTNLYTSDLTQASSIQIPIPPSVIAQQQYLNNHHHRKQGGGGCDDNMEIIGGYGGRIVPPPKPILSITPTASVASIDVMIRTAINPLVISPLIDTVAFAARQFSVVFTLSSAALQAQREAVLVAARQNATDRAFTQAQAQNAQLGAMISERPVSVSDIAVVPVAVTTPLQIQLLLTGNSTDRVKIRAQVQKTFGILPRGDNNNTLITTTNNNNNITPTISVTPTSITTGTGTTTTTNAMHMPMNMIGGTIQYA